MLHTNYSLVTTRENSQIDSDGAGRVCNPFNSLRILLMNQLITASLPYLSETHSSHYIFIRHLQTKRRPPKILQQIERQSHICSTLLVIIPCLFSDQCCISDCPGSLFKLFERQSSANTSKTFLSLSQENILNRCTNS